MTPEFCRECGHSVEWGSGMFVNRLDCGDGEYLCAECQMFDCDRCGEPTLEIYTADDGSQLVCEDCVTKSVYLSSKPVKTGGADR